MVNEVRRLFETNRTNLLDSLHIQRLYIMLLCPLSLVPAQRLCRTLQLYHMNFVHISQTCEQFFFWMLIVRFVDRKIDCIVIVIMVTFKEHINILKTIMQPMNKMTCKIIICIIQYICCIQGITKNDSIHSHIIDLVLLNLLLLIYCTGYSNWNLHSTSSLIVNLLS